MIVLDISLPRRISRERFNRQTVERVGANMIIRADETFTTISTVSLGQDIPGRGFSSCKFIPGTEDQLMVALKSEEIEGKVATYMMVFNMEGKVLFQEEKIGDRKFEGIEFLAS